MSDLVLVYPETGMDIMPTIGPPHSVMAIATLPFRAGYKVRIIDQRLEHNWREIIKGELETHPLLVGISAMTGNRHKNLVFGGDGCALVIVAILPPSDHER
jgi:hypothetical protein